MTHIFPEMIYTNCDMYKYKTQFIFLAYDHNLEIAWYILLGKYQSNCETRAFIFPQQI